MQITLIDGSVRQLNPADPAALDQLHWEQERAFAQRILQSPRGSAERAEAFRDGYDTITKIITVREGSAEGSGLVMGLSPRYVRLVLRLLRRFQARGASQPQFFEIGYGSGAVLEAVARESFAVAGVEVSAYMREQAMARLPKVHHAGLLLGDFLTLDLAAWRGCHVAYWNDVLEHLPPDESLDFLRRTHDLLAPGGVLVTITPNWHTRPTDITKLFRPPRSPAEGFHLREHTLREVTALLRRAGFARVATPLCVTSRRTFLLGQGLSSLKCLLEPLLEFLPYSAARLICRGAALNTTLAWKGA